MWVTLYICTVLCIVAHIRANVPDQFWIPKEAVYSILCISVFATSLFFDKIKYRTFKNKWFSAFFILIMIEFMTYFYAPQVVPIPRFEWNVWNYRPTLNLFFTFFLIITLYEYSKDLTEWVNFTKFLCWVGFIMACFGILQWLQFDEIFQHNYKYIFVNNLFERKRQVVTFLSNEFLTGNFLAMLSPLCLAFKPLRYKLMYITMFICVVLTLTSSSLFAFVLAFFVYLFFTRRFKTLIALSSLSVILGIVFAYYNPELLANGGRLSLWQKVVGVILNDNMHELFGSGLGSFAGKFQIDVLVALSAHNEYLQIFYECGIIGLIIVIGYVITLSRRILITWVEKPNFLFLSYICGFVAYLVICITGFPLRIAPLALIGVLYIVFLELQTSQ